MLDLETLAEICKTLAAMRETEAWLAQADRSARLHLAEHPLDRDQLSKLILQSNMHYQELIESVNALTGLAQRMLDQRQSVREAFNQGWDARMKDLSDQLTAEEYAQLRRALEKMQKK